MNKSSMDRYLNPRALLRIVFPEIQLFDHIREVGMVNKDYFANRSRKSVSLAKNRAVGSVPKSGSYRAQVTGAAGRMVGAAAESLDGNVMGVENAVTGAVSRAETQRTDHFSNAQIDDLFYSVQNDMRPYILEQDGLVEGLCAAFKRPFLDPPEKSYRNLFFICGRKGTGKHLSVDVIARLLRDRGLLTRGTVGHIDLSRYATEKDAEQLFLSDLYRVLYGMDPIIVFDGYEKCHSSVQDKLTRLAVDGSLKLDKRYMEQLGRMSDVTGALVASATDELQANEKYLIFVSETPVSALQNKLPRPMLDSMSDMLESNPLSEAALRKIATLYLNDFVKKTADNLGLSVRADAAVLPLLLHLADPTQGTYGLLHAVDQFLHDPVVELSLKNKLHRGDSCTIYVQNEAFFLQGPQTQYDLSNVIARHGSESLEELNKEMDQIVGLASVKQFIRELEDNLRLQKARSTAGEKTVRISLHMVFSGNPGTGKTTMARLVAKYLKAFGYLSSGHLVETARADLVGQYVGETAQKTTQKIRSALGGVLFIDEAYSLVRDKSDPFGIEAVDTLVKAMEDNRDNLVVILAGYTDEMQELLKTNPGLKSRFNYFVEFPDYTPEELLQILKINAAGEGYQLAPECDEPLLSQFERSQIPGKNDSGNGRLARNILEKAQLRCTERFKGVDLTEVKKEDLNTLIPADFELAEKPPLDLNAELSQIIGLETVKTFILGLQKQLIADTKRKQAGLKVDNSQSLNMIFTGNPGTGKTTMARLIAKLMKELGVLKSGQLIETSKTDFVSEYAGKTAQKTEELFRKALGGILFIDEAYALADGAGQEAIDTLVKLIEDHRKDTVVILAGYEKEMQRFLGANSGLASRFPLQTHFSDYTLEELLQIAGQIANQKGYQLSEGGQAGLKTEIAKRMSDGGNGRLARNIVEEAIRRQSARIADSTDLSSQAMVILEKSDFLSEQQNSVHYDLEKDLGSVVGLSEAKDFLRSLQAQIIMDKKRKELGLPASEQQTLHMIFQGNPGTGKTTMARIAGHILHDLGVLREDKLIETDRSGLVAGYVGQTAIKTKEVIQSAYNGVLFIDEAYSLAKGGENDFGREAIDTLVKEMDDNRSKLVVILAGYDHDMEVFLQTNPGLRSRFPNILHFADYSAEELMEIAQRNLSKDGYILSPAASGKLLSILEQARTDSAFGNGRYVRNLMEAAERHLDARLMQEQNLTKDKLTTIEEIDIEVQKA